MFCPPPPPPPVEGGTPQYKLYRYVTPQRVWFLSRFGLKTIFYVYCCESPVKLTHQVGRFYHMSFQNCHIAAIGEKNRQVCPHQSVAKFACNFRWRSNSPRSAYKIARCVAGLRPNLKEKLPSQADLLSITTSTGKVLEQVHSARLLGLDIDSALSFSDHIERLCKSRKSWHKELVF